MSGISQGMGADVGVQGDIDFREAFRKQLGLSTIYRFECFDKHGHLKWIEEIPNLVVNEGLDDVLTQFFKGSGYTAAFSVGLIDNAGFDVLGIEDDAAGIITGGPTSGSNGWGEVTEYDEATREVLTLGSIVAQSVDNTASKASFAINATITINGAFVVRGDTAKLGTSGTLYGEASFASARSAESGDTLNVTVTLTSASL